MPEGAWHQLAAAFVEPYISRHASVSQLGHNVSHHVDVGLAVLAWLSS